MRIILSTTDIFSCTPSGGVPWRAQIKKFEGAEYDYWSTGILEAAQAAGHMVLIASTRTTLGEHDSWWIELVGRENVFLAEEVDHEKLLSLTLADICARNQEEGRCTSAGWIATFEACSIPWPIYQTGDPLHWLEASRKLKGLGMPRREDFETRR